MRNLFLAIPIEKFTFTLKNGVAFNEQTNISTQYYTAHISLYTSSETIQISGDSLIVTLTSCQ